MNAERRFARVAGLQFHYWDWGGDGRPLVLMHATGFHGAVWAPIAEALLPEFRPIAPDARGHGDSDKPASGYAWERLGADLGGLLASLQLSNVVAVGHSSGAAAVVICAANRPGSIARAVLLDPTIHPRDTISHAAPPPNPLADGARRRRSHWDSREQAFAAYRSKPPFDSWREDVLRLYVEHGLRDLPDGGFDLKCPPWAEAQVYDHAMLSPAFGLLPRVPGHTLVLYGEHSPMMSEGAAERIGATLPAATVEAMPGTGHFLPMERPGAVAARIRRFLLDET